MRPFLSVHDDLSSADNTLIATTPAAAPFALVLNDTPVARVPPNKFLDACAEVHIAFRQHETINACELSIAGLRLPSDVMAALPEYRSPVEALAAAHFPCAAEQAHAYRLEIETVAPICAAAHGRAPSAASIADISPSAPPATSRDNSDASAELSCPLSTTAACRPFRRKPWSNRVRGFPSVLARMGLFTPTRAPTKTSRGHRPLSTTKNYVASARGPLPTEADFSVYLGAIHLTRRIIEGEVVTTTMVKMIEAADRTDGTKTRLEMIRALKRLARCEVSIRIDSLAIEYRGPLLTDVSIFKSPGGQRMVRFRIPPGIYEMFDAGISHVSLEDRRKVAKHPLAAWLQAWLATHKKPYPYRASKLHEMSGLRCTKFEFDRRLEFALTVLRRAQLISDWSRDEASDLVRIVRPAYPSRKQSPLMSP